MLCLWYGLPRLSEQITLWTGALPIASRGGGGVIAGRCRVARHSVAGVGSAQSARATFGALARKSEKAAVGGPAVLMLYIARHR